MKHLKFFVCLGAAATVLSAADTKSDIKVVEEIVAKVNGDIVTRMDLESARRDMEKDLQQHGVAGTQFTKLLDEHSKDILREKIDELLLVQKGNQLSIKVDTEVSKYLAQIQLQNKIADPEKFHDWIRQQLGIPFEDFKQQLQNDMLKRRVLQQEVGRQINIPHSAAQKYYNEHKNEFMRDERIFLHEILVSTDGKDEKGIAAAEKKAKDLVVRARRGEKFPEMARDNSDAASAPQGGDIGSWKRGVLDPKLEALVWEKPKNYVTDPLKTDKGFLILKVDDHYKAGLADFDEVETEVQDKLYAPLFEPKVREYLTKLREEAFLEIRDGFVDTGAASGKDTRWHDPAQLKPETVTKEEVAAAPRHRKFLKIIPLPGAKAAPVSKSQALK